MADHVGGCCGVNEYARELSTLKRAPHGRLRISRSASPIETLDADDLPRIQTKDLLYEGTQSRSDIFRELPRRRITPRPGTYNGPGIYGFGRRVAAGWYGHQYQGGYVNPTGLTEGLRDGRCTEVILTHAQCRPTNLSVMKDAGLLPRMYWKNPGSRNWLVLFLKKSAIVRTNRVAKQQQAFLKRNLKWSEL